MLKRRQPVTLLALCVHLFDELLRKQQSKKKLTTSGRFNMKNEGQRDNKGEEIGFISYNIRCWMSLISIPKKYETMKTKEVQKGSN